MQQRLLIISLTIALMSCGYRVTKSLDGQNLIDQSNFKFNQPMTEKNFDIIDTSTVYKKVPAQNWDYNEYLKFYSNGSYIHVFKKTDFSKTDLYVDKNSVWRGRFILTGNNIETEGFYPNQAPIKTYYRQVLSGQIKGDTIIINWDKGRTKYIYIRQY
jgi:hypothetical protein